MTIPAWLALVLLLGLIFGPLLAFYAGAWVHHAGRTGKSPVPAITRTRKPPEESPRPKPPRMEI